jgi:hypothetical protein
MPQRGAQVCQAGIKGLRWWDEWWVASWGSCWERWSDLASAAVERARQTSVHDPAGRQPVVTPRTLTWDGANDGSSVGRWLGVLVGSWVVGRVVGTMVGCCVGLVVESWLGPVGPWVGICPGTPLISDHSIRCSRLRQCCSYHSRGLGRGDAGLLGGGLGGHERRQHGRHHGGGLSQEAWCERRTGVLCLYLLPHPPSLVAESG